MAHQFPLYNGELAVVTTMLLKRVVPVHTPPPIPSMIILGVDLDTSGGRGGGEVAVVEGMVTETCIFGG